MTRAAALAYPSEGWDAAWANALNTLAEYFLAAADENHKAQQALMDQYRRLLVRLAAARAADFTPRLNAPDADVWPGFDVYGHQAATVYLNQDLLAAAGVAVAERLRAARDTPSQQSRV